jgi:ATP-dependent phosphofructokinase / diphosphate-dependent phosphofructokinase
MEPQRKRLGILVGGGPAPGINSAISATVIEAVNEDLEVVGIYDGYEHLMQGRTDMVRPLTIEGVSRIHFQGGSILRTARANPTRHPDDMQRTLQTLQALNIGALVTIGGDDTAFASSEVAKAANGTLRVAHIPKTIDNDLPLPGGVSTFGFETARHIGTQLVRNLMEDARTTNRWIFVVVMGRKAGHLALGIGKAAGSTLTIIPEEFPQDSIRLEHVSRILEGAILKRRVMGSEHGVAVIAEGISEKLDPEELAKMPGVEMVYDPYGHIRLGEIPLTTILKRQVQEQFATRQDSLSIVDVTLGYELRCAQAIPFDVDYTRTLGYGAVRFLLSEPTDGRTRQAGFICLEGGHLNVLPFDDMRDPSTGRIRVRVVDVCSEHYHVARKYMIRLEHSDLEDGEMCAKLAVAAHMTPDEFLHAYRLAVTTPEGWSP